MQHPDNNKHIQYKDNQIILNNIENNNNNNKNIKEENLTETLEEDTTRYFSFSTEYSKQTDSNLDTNSNHYRNILSDLSNESAFTILNNDHFNPLLVTDKPNAIVHPIRRTNRLTLRRSNNHIDRPNDNDNHNDNDINNYDDIFINGIHIDTGHHKNGSTSIATTTTHKENIENFAKELNKRLYRLTNARSYGSLTNYRNKNVTQNVNQQNVINERPLFITTVARGKFLPPPKEIFLIAPRPQKQHIYAYSSHPVVYHNLRHSQPSPAKLYAKPKDCHGMTNRNTNPNAITNTITNTTTIGKYKNKYYTRAFVKDKRQNNEISSKINENDNENENEMVNTRNNFMNDINYNKINNNNNDNDNDDNRINILKSLNNNSKAQQQQEVKQEQRYRFGSKPAEPYKNVMYDKRVVRGSVFSPQALLCDYDPFDKATERRRRLALRKTCTCPKNRRNTLGDPPPLPGRYHEAVQTEKYLKELVIKPMEVTIETQTDLFLEKPPTPPYIPAKIGVDASTEIADGELFHFDAEAQPIIDVLVDSTIELSILEVAHEQEMAAIRERQDELLAQREAELAELRRLEAEEIRLQAEKQRRLHQDKITKALDDEMQKEVTAAKLLQGHIYSIIPEIIESLEPAVDATKKDVLMKTLCPWLSAEVASEVGQIVDSRDILTNIIKEIIKQRAEVYAGYKEEIEPPEKIDEEEHEGCELEIETESDSVSHLRCPPENKDNNYNNEKHENP